MLLIIEDDPHYARILLGLARDNGFKGIVATKGAQALALARQFRPAAISLDIFLPDMLGWTVLNQLKLDPATRHIPVQIVTLEEERQHGLAHGAFAYLVKEPTTDGLEAAFDRIKEFTARAHQAAARGRGQRRSSAPSIVELLDDDDIETVAVGSGKEALAAMRDQAVRLRRARPAPARHDRLRPAREGPCRAGAGRRAGRRLHRQGPHRRRAWRGSRRWPRASC